MNKLKRLFRYDWPLHFVLLLTNWLPDNVAFLRLRGALASPFFKECGRDLRLGRNITFYNPSHISLGDNIYIALGCWFMAGDEITIDDQVIFGPYCVIVTSNHTRHNTSFRYGKNKNEPITINSGSWIAAHCTVLAGSHVGSGTVIAANSVVRGEIPADCVAGGQPAKVLREYDE